MYLCDACACDLGVGGPCRGAGWITCASWKGPTATEAGDFCGYWGSGIDNQEQEYHHPEKRSNLGTTIHPGEDCKGWSQRFYPPWGRKDRWCSHCKSSLKKTIIINHILIFKLYPLYDYIGRISSQQFHSHILNSLSLCLAVRKERVLASQARTLRTNP